MNKKRGVLIAGNWKMNQTVSETEKFFSAFDPSTQVQICLFPPMLSLVAAKKAADKKSVTIGAQNVHWEKKGAFTGEISGPMLSEIGIHWALVGHSERRQYFGETDETAQKRTESLLAQGFDVMLCIGETRAARDAGKTEEVLARQIKMAWPKTAPVEKLVLAYEPVWAIGTGLTATPEQAESAHAFIRGAVPKEVGDKIKILYGGSATPEAISALLACPNIDGVLAGGASLKPESFRALVDAAEKLLPKG